MTASTFEFRLADVGEGLHEAEVKHWLVQTGDHVTLDQPLVEIETDKAVVELPSPVAGTIAQLGADEGTILHVGDLVALLETDVTGRAARPETVALDRPTANAVADRDGGSKQETTADAVPSRRALATPAVRKLARDRGVDIAAVSGSGPGGRVVAEDIERLARSNAERSGEEDGGATTTSLPPAGTNLATPWLSPQPSEGDTRRPLRGLRRRIAQTMTQAWSTIPHITGFDEIEVSALVSARERLKPPAEARGARLTYLVFIVKAVALALREYPIVNSSLDGAADEIVYHAAINIGIATATTDGLIVPVLHDADRRTLIEAQQQIDALTERARARTSTPDELRGGTFTITNFGALGGWQASPIIRPGEAAILGAGRIQDRPWAVDGRVEVRPVLPLSLAADHRLIDGDISTAFLTRVGSLLSAPETMLLDMR